MKKARFAPLAVVVIMIVSAVACGESEKASAPTATSEPAAEEAVSLLSDQEVIANVRRFIDGREYRSLGYVGVRVPTCATGEFKDCSFSGSAIGFVPRNCLRGIEPANWTVRHERGVYTVTATLSGHLFHKKDEHAWRFYEQTLVVEPALPAQVC